MANQRCRKIKDIEQRLLCLKEKYDNLTNQLEESRNNSSSDAGLLDYHQLIEERRIIEKYMNNLTNKIISHEKANSKRISQTGERIVLGNVVEIENTKSHLIFELVEEITSPNQSQISAKSPIGQEVLGKRVGEEIFVQTPNGKIHYKIKSIQ